jgi:hypothetical protein
LDLFILDALADDLENLEDILRQLNSAAIGWRHLHPEPFVRQEILPALTRLIREDLVEACVLDQSGKWLIEAGPRTLPAGSWDDPWFRLTARGRIVHSTWDPELPLDA